MVDHPVRLDFYVNKEDLSDITTDLLFNYFFKGVLEV